MVTLKTKEILKKYQNQRNFRYENDSHFIDGIHFDVINEIIPYRSSYIDRVRNWRFRPLFGTDTYYNYKYIRLPGKELFDYIVDEFIVYDIFGNIIMTLDDITEDSFREELFDMFIDVYDDEFINDFQYEFFNINETRYQIFYGIFITQDIINVGRIKYGN
jgi:hypothetical protein